jgi:hypothetical protein
MKKQIGILLLEISGIVLVSAISCVLLFGQESPTGTKTGAQLREQITTVGIVSGAPGATFANDVGAVAKVTFGEIILGAPASVSIVLSGCMRGSGAVANICDVLETNVTNSNTNRHPANTVLYDYFLIVPTFTGGTTPTLTVVYTAAN